MCTWRYWCLWLLLLNLMFRPLLNRSSLQCSGCYYHYHYHCLSFLCCNNWFAILEFHCWALHGRNPVTRLWMHDRNGVISNSQLPLTKSSPWWFPGACDSIRAQQCCPSQYCQGKPLISGNLLQFKAECTLPKRKHCPLAHFHWEK